MMPCNSLMGFNEYKIRKKRIRKRLVENFLINDTHNLNEGLYQKYLKTHFESCLL